MSPPLLQRYRDRRIERSLLPPSASGRVAHYSRKQIGKKMGRSPVTSLIRHPVTKLREATRHGAFAARTAGWQKYCESKAYQIDVPAEPLPPRLPAWVHRAAPLDGGKASTRMTLSLAI